MIFIFFLKKAEEVIVNSIAFKKEIDKKFNIKSKVIYNPFDFNLIKKKSTIKLKNRIFKKNTLKLLTIGRLTDQKDHKTLIKAIQIASKKINISAIIIGKGFLKNSLNNLINKFNLQKNVKIVGYKKNPFNFIKASDLTILTSKFEGHPNVLVEAQFLKKYIISTDCPTGPREILGNGKFGKLIKVGDYKSLSRIIVNYKLTSKIQKQINDGFNQHTKYDLNKNCKKYQKLILKHT
tara:strand:- start:12 stop:719 length:708 start_codon:yes stop_codon:yes gene_type:complete